MRLYAENSKCTGCRVCQMVCGIKHFKEINPKKTAIGINAKFPDPGVYEPVICIQCGTCANVCPVEAITMKDNAYVIDPDVCTGCHTCVEECPQQCMFLHPDSHVPMKCDLCGECVEMCPTKTLSMNE